MPDEGIQTDSKGALKVNAAWAVRGLIGVLMAWGALSLDRMAQAQEGTNKEVQQLKVTVAQLSIQINQQDAIIRRLEKLEDRMNSGR